MGSNYTIRGRIWIDKGAEAFIGDGKYELLQKIKVHGSLSKAASSMNMSYKKAWLSVKKINKFSEQELIVLSRGGSKGGKAVLTPNAEKLIKRYQDLQAEFDNFLKAQNESWQQEDVN